MKVTLTKPTSFHAHTGLCAECSGLFTTDCSGGLPTNGSGLLPAAAAAAAGLGLPELHTGSTVAGRAGIVTRVQYISD